MGIPLELSAMGWVAAAVLLAVAWVAARAMVGVLWRPWRLERELRKQGIRGTRYRLFFGDTVEENRVLIEAQTKPISPFSHHIIPRLAPFLYDTVQRYGKMSLTWFGPTPRVTIMDPELIREILNNRYNHFGRIEPNPLELFLTAGFSTMDGEKWVKHRKLVTPAFQLEKLKLMFPAFSTCCHEMISRWEKLAPPEGSFELDAWQEFQTLTGNVISKTAFGSSYEEGKRIFSLQIEQSELFVEAFRHIYIPGHRFLPTKNNNRRLEIHREIRDIVVSIIKKRERELQLGKIAKVDVLGLLMEANLQGSNEDGDSKDMALTVEQVIEECKLFYFAGQETTSTLLTWTMVALSMDKKWQGLAREEVLQLYGKNTPDIEDLSRLKIVTMIINEVLRLYAPPINLFRRTLTKSKLGEVTFPPGVQLVMPVLLVHRDPDLWGEDANQFRPDRFAEGIAKASKNPAAFFPFGGGQRICIGKQFALLEAKLALTSILQHFSFDLSPSYTHAPHSIITLQPQHGAEIILHKL